ncbi:MAG TPA: tRNA (adenosine(37)-N6)-threonylcarbamoyltransferase complex transferase subunit TsaD [Methylocystis sp.]|nr:tRNA (adenosine(37)-N6)-threonylcarbamoyltransferase complex transferase subunit TsaD [Methylocystis sp.]
MRVLGIETTCDETAVGVVEERLGGGQILANEVMSQIARHAAYGGVVPEIAARAHIEVLDRLVARALESARIEAADLDAVAAAAGPGLIGGVLVGLTAGKALAFALQKPFIAINHLEAHALTARLTDGVDFPYLALLLSGGHTQIVAVHGVGDYRRLGSTVDDAAGEAFDKVGKMLGLPYPGGPAIEELARDGEPTRFDLPRPMLGRPGADFSLSGLKTAVRLELLKLGESPSDQDKRDLAASFQAAIVDVVVDRVRSALRDFAEGDASSQRPNALVIGGGVGANGAIRWALTRCCAEAGLRFLAPPPALCADNGAMIAWAGMERLKLGLVDELDFAARPRWPLDASASAAHHGKA